MLVQKKEREPQRKVCVGLVWPPSHRYPKPFHFIPHFIPPLWLSIQQSLRGGCWIMWYSQLPRPSKHHPHTVPRVAHPSLSKVIWRDWVHESKFSCRDWKFIMAFFRGKKIEGPVTGPHHLSSFNISCLLLNEVDKPRYESTNHWEFGTSMRKTW